MSVWQYYGHMGTLSAWTANPNPRTLAAARVAWRKLVAAGYARADRVPTVRGWPALLKDPEGHWLSWPAIQEAAAALAVFMLPGGGMIAGAELLQGRTPRQTAELLEAGVEAAGETITTATDKLYRWGVAAAVLVVVFLLATALRGLAPGK